MTLNFLQGFTKLLEKTEVPPRFAIWSGISCLLATLERRLSIPQGIYNVYPNFFIILIAASGQKKSTPINLVDRLLRSLNPGVNIVAQKVSPEALIQALQRQESADSKKLLSEKCGGIVIADELATFLDRGALDRGLGPILTKLYDCSNFDYQTIKHGTQTVHGGYLSILGGTTVELLRNSLPKDAIGGGFTSRTIFVYEDKIAPPIPWVDFDAELIELEERLVEHLQKLLTLSGRVTLSADAREYYENAYRQRYSHGDFRKNANLQGYENRRWPHCFKVAIALMVAEGPALEMTSAHIKGADYLLSEAEEHMPQIMDLITASDMGAQGNQVFQYIKSRGEEGISRSEVVRHFGSKMDSDEISKVVSTLILGNRVNAYTNPGSPKLMYKVIK